MKKLYLFLLLFLAGAFSTLLTSCEKSDTEQGDDTPVVVPANSFAYNNEVQPFGSALYVYDEVETTYTFYFSPSEGITTLEAMWQADDYLRITTSLPSGDIDLTQAGNELMYKNIVVSASTVGNIVSSSLQLRLPSLTEVKMEAKVETADGQTLDANYDGTCIRITEEREQGPAVELDTPIFSWYIGQSGAGTNDYYIAVGNVPYSIYQGTQFSLTSAGYALLLDCYFDSGDEWRTFPTGTFKSSARYGDHTYHPTNSFMLQADGAGGYQQMPLSSDVVIEREGTITTITTAFIDGSGAEHEVSFTGDLRVGYGLSMPTMPHLMADIELEGFYAEGIYHGDLFESGSGLSEVVIYDEASENNEEDGMAVRMLLASTKFLNPKTERKLVEDNYTRTTASNLSEIEQGTWAPVTELEIMGMVLPFGTYGATGDSSTETGYYSYANDGTIEVKELGGSEYEITFDLEAQSGYAIKGSFTGDVFLTDQSDDNDNDGSSTLTEDLHLDLTYLDQARCFPQTEVYVTSQGYIPVDEITTYASPGAIAPCGYQYIEFGLPTGTYKHDPTGEFDDPGRLVAGDAFRIDLLVEPGDEDKISTGVYTVSRNRYLNTMQPGVCYRGVQADYHIGTRWLDISSAIGNGIPTYSHSGEEVINGWLNRPSVFGYASLYEGTVTVTKAEGGDNWYTFVIDGEDVLHHKITGTWTGPVVMGNSDDPVEGSGRDFKEEESASSGSAGGDESEGASVKAEQHSLRHMKPVEGLRDYVTLPPDRRPVERVRFR